MTKLDRIIRKKLEGKKLTTEEATYARSIRLRVYRDGRVYGDTK